jgi:glycosyltransferase involved in cell wall biosynthesis
MASEMSTAIATDEMKKTANPTPRIAAVCGLPPSIAAKIRDEGPCQAGLMPNASLTAETPESARVPASPGDHARAASLWRPARLQPGSPMRILVFTTLFPNAAAPSHGVFVENRLRAFRAKYDCDIKVIAPVPWFPFQNETFGRYARWARAPKQEWRNGVEVLHPRYALPPKIGMHFALKSLERCLWRTVKQLQSEGWAFDFIDAHYLYPDAAAATACAARIGVPVAITARGSDVTLLPKYPGPRRAILDAVLQADAVIAVAATLKNELARLGAPEQKIAVLRNGVDLERYRPRDRKAVRAEMGLSGPVLLSAGHLIDRKGHDLVLKALAELPEATLLIAGDGEKNRSLRKLARFLGVHERVRFLGSASPDKMPDLFCAADLLVLASSREGWANVLLEAMACGTPCIATKVGAAPDIIQDPAAGRLIAERTPEAIAQAAKSLLADPPTRTATRRYAERFSWDETGAAMAAVFAELKSKADTQHMTRIAPIAFNYRAMHRKRKFLSPLFPAKAGIQSRTHGRSTLLLDPGFRRGERDRPKLIVTVDAEEKFDWSNFDDTAHALAPLEDIERFQLLCSEAGVSPLYFLTFPLLAHEETAAYFSRICRAEAAHCGLHFHQWSTPPHEFRGEYFSFQKNLPRAAYRDKLHMLAKRFEAAFGKPGEAHRAGRYGIGPADYAALAEIGVRFDFSPSPGFDASHRGGPDFTACSNRPFTAGGGDGAVYVTPVCGARALRGTRRFFCQEPAPNGFAPLRRSLTGKALQPMRLSPEGASLADLKALTRRLIADQTPVLTFTLHSTSLTPGANPYARQQADIENLLDTTRSYFSWFRQSAGGEIISFHELKALYENEDVSMRA